MNIEVEEMVASIRRNSTHVVIQTTTVVSAAAEEPGGSSPAEVIRGLLAALPECWGCKHTATRVCYSKPLAAGPYGVIALPTSGAHGQRFFDGRMQSDCCDDHDIEGADGSWPLPYAGHVRAAQLLLERLA
jgi:hypothetical protein